MLQVTPTAAAILKQARDRTGIDSNAAVRLKPAEQPGRTDNEKLIGLDFTEKPEDGDQTIEQEDLKLYVASDLVEPLSERVLDAETTEQGTQLLFR
jgi:Fe-S cluster assembly iron-binding protein IscA